MEKLIERVHKFILQQNMIANGSPIIVGVSGGADSVCLICVLAKLRETFELKLQVVHVNHGIRGSQADADELFVKKLCEQLGIPCVCHRVNVPQLAEQKHLSLEEAGREVRYGIFEHTVRNMTESGKHLQQRNQSDGTACETQVVPVVAVAHHMDDQAETVLMNIVRGTALKGVGGMQPVSDREYYRLIRPLLCVTRTEIEAFLQENQQDFCIDQTNADNDYMRNRIRNEVLPYLTEHINAGVISNVSALAETARKTCRYMEQQARKTMESCVTEYLNGRVYRIALKAFAQEAEVLQQEVVHQLLIRIAGAQKDIYRKHIMAAVELVHREVGRQVDVAYAIRGMREADAVILGKADAVEKLLQQEMLMRVEQQMWYGRAGWFVSGAMLACEQNPQVFEENDYTKLLDYDKINFNLQLRTGKKGDFIQINQTGGTKRMSRFLIDEKVPQMYRDRVLVVADGSEIVWVVGYRISSRYQITSETKRIAKLSVR